MNSEQYKRARDWKLHLATHVTNFLLFPTIVFAVRLCVHGGRSALTATPLAPRAIQIVSCVRAADPNFEKFDRYAMVGMVVLVSRAQSRAGGVELISRRSCARCRVAYRRPSPPMW